MPCDFPEISRDSDFTGERQSVHCARILPTSAQFLRHSGASRAKRSILAIALLGAMSVAWANAENDLPPHQTWSYDGTTDPAHWGDIDPEFAMCATGTMQSPIDIHGAKPAHLGVLQLHYPATRARVFNTEHTIEVQPAEGGTLITPSGTYRLTLFHFHTPSETRFNGRAYPLSAHFVHRNDEGRIAVVAVMFRLGKASAPLATPLRTLPEAGDPPVPLPGTLSIASLLPHSLAYYTYSGSLTTPPCTEGVQWYVLKQPLTISAAQLRAFRKRYPMNARPVQPLDGRTVAASQ